ncbi:MAG: hypothetical protein LBD51_03915, partial [Bifidobacteriaceae bacterium]|nr:hypothetical protein [Bifidobacteriaceae bacterium]
MVPNAAEAGFVRVAACSLPVRLADPPANAHAIGQLASQAAAKGASLVVFPELCLTGYSLEDLFMQNALLDASDQALASLAAATAGWPAAIVVGAPIRAGHRLYNCAAVLAAGRVLGAVPKSYLPNYREFYEHRQFASGLAAPARARLAGHDFPLTPRQIFDLALPDAAPATPSPASPAGSRPARFTLGVEVCEDLWVPISPGAEAALAGAEVIANLSGSPITVAKSRERRALAAAQSAKLICGYVYAASGLGESSTDLSWDGQTLVFERGELLAEGPRFSREPVATLMDLDLAVIRQDRLRQGSFDDNRVANLDRLSSFTRTPATLPPPAPSPAAPAPASSAAPPAPAAAPAPAS